MQYLINELRKTKGKEEVRKLFNEMFSYMPSFLYNGYPATIDEDSFDLRTVEKEIKQKRGEYEKLAKVIGQSIPRTILEARRRFEKNASQMLVLSRMSEAEREDLPWSQHFPYFDDFDGAVKDSVSYYKPHTDGTIKLEDITFSDNLIGDGAYGEVYFAKCNGIELILKLFKEGIKVPKSVRESVQERVWAIKSNVKKNMPILTPEIFATPRIVGETMADWYIADFFNGKDVFRRVLQQREFSPSAPPEEVNHFIGIGLAKFTEALQHLHNKGFLFMDTSLDAILVKDNANRINDARVIDYDFVISEEEIKDPTHPFRGIYHPAFIAKEQILKRAPKKITDLEALASSAHYIFATEKFGKSRFYGIDVDLLLQVAQNNQFNYSPQKNAPENVARIMKGLLTYPRDEGIRAEDFREAVRKDYGI